MEVKELERTVVMKEEVRGDRSKGNVVANLNSKIVSGFVISVAAQVHPRRTGQGPSRARPHLLPRVHPQRPDPVLALPLPDLPTRPHNLPVHERHQEARVGHPAQAPNGRTEDPHRQIRVPIGLEIL